MALYIPWYSAIDDTTIDLDANRFSLSFPSLDRSLTRFCFFLLGYFSGERNQICFAKQEMPTILKDYQMPKEEEEESMERKRFLCSKWMKIA